MESAYSLAPRITAITLNTYKKTKKKIKNKKKPSF